MREFNFNINFYLHPNRATFKVAEKSILSTFPSSPGTYRRISATKELLRDEAQAVRFRHQHSHEADPRVERMSATRRSCAQILAAKMAEVPLNSCNAWPNTKDDYELGEVIGMSLFFN